MGFFYKLSDLLGLNSTKNQQRKEISDLWSGMSNEDLNSKNFITFSNKLYQLLHAIYEDRKKNNSQSKLFNSIVENKVFESEIQISEHVEPKIIEDWLSKVRNIKGGHGSVWTDSAVNIVDKLYRKSKEKIEKDEYKNKDDKIIKESDNHINPEKQKDETKQMEVKFDEKCKQLINSVKSLRYSFTPKGKKMSIPNPLTLASVDNESKDSLKEKLKKMCEKFNITKGIDEGSVNTNDTNDALDSAEGSWKIPVWKYFFEESYLDNPNVKIFNSNIYDRSDFPTESKVKLAKCVKTMYDQIENKDWRDIIESCLYQLSSHGGHCPARAEGLVNSVYDSLIKFFKEKNIIKYESFDDYIFYLFKLKIQEYANRTSLNVNMENAKKSGAEYMVQHAWTQKAIEGFLGFGESQIQSNISNWLCGSMMSTSNLLELSHNMLNKAEDNLRSGVLSALKNTKLTFTEYSQYCGRSGNDLKKFLSSVSEISYDSEYLQEIKNWILGKIELTSEYAVYEIGTIFGFQEPSDLPLVEIKYPFGVHFLIYCVLKGYLELG